MLKDKVIITASLTGAVTPKEINPYIPLTPKEIAEDAYKCWKAGASVVHMHMRDDEGRGTMDKEKFRETIGLIKEKNCDIVINCTSSGQRGASDERRMEHFKEVGGIEMGSYDAGSLNWMPTHVFMNPPSLLNSLGLLYKEKGIKPEIEIFDAGMLGITDYYVKQNVLERPLHYQFVLGVLGGMPATVENLVYLQSKIPEGSTWSAFGVGKGHLPIMFATLALGGHLRVGLEDNVYLSKGVKASNVQLVERAVKAIELFGKEVATPAEARKILGLKQLV